MNHLPTFVDLGVKLKLTDKPFYSSRRLEATLSSKTVSDSAFMGVRHSDVSPSFQTFSKLVEGSHTMPGDPENLQDRGKTTLYYEL
jgi:hypothetical protein